MSIEARQIQKTLYSYAAILNFTPSPQGLRAKFGACSVQNAQLFMHKTFFISTKGPVTRCNFSPTLQCNSTLGRCKIGKYKFPSQFANIFLAYQTFVTNLHLLGVELCCKLQEKLHRVTGP